MGKVNGERNSFAPKLEYRDFRESGTDRVNKMGDARMGVTSPYNIESSFEFSKEARKKKVVIFSSYNWVPDDEAQECKVCKARFWVLKRKHHCRSCCYVFCRGCTCYRIPVLLHKRQQCTLRLCEGCFSKLFDNCPDSSVVLEAHSASQFKVLAGSFYAKELNLERNQVLFINRKSIRNAHSEERRQIDVVRKSVIGMMSNPLPPSTKSFSGISPSRDTEGCPPYFTPAELITIPSDRCRLCEILGICPSSLGYYLEVQKRCLERLKIDSDPRTGEFILKTLSFLKENVLLYPLVKFSNRIGEFVKVKKVKQGELKDSEFYKGLAFSNFFPHKLMLHHTTSPKILLISFPMGYAATIPRVVSITRDLHKEYDFKNSLVHTIKALAPNIVFSSSSVPYSIVEKLAEENIQIMPNIKHSLIVKMSDLSNAPIINSSSLLGTNTELGSCSSFIIRNVSNSNKIISVLSKENSTPYFSIILKGPNLLYLRSLKMAIHYMIQVYCNIKVESYLTLQVSENSAGSSSPNIPYFDYPKLTEKNFLKAVISFRGQQSQTLYRDLVLGHREPSVYNGYSTLRYCYPSGRIINDKNTLQRAMVKVQDFLIYRRTEHTRKTFIILTRYFKRLSFCTPPEIADVQIFDKGDVSIAELITNMRSSSMELCQSVGCRQKLFEHLKYYVGSNHMIIISMRYIGEDTYSTRTKIYVECNECDLKTSPVVLPMYCLAYSFGRLLELYQYRTLLNLPHSAYVKGCKHHKNYRYIFTYKDTEIVIQPKPLKVYTLSIPIVIDSAAEWRATHTKLKSRSTMMREIYSYFIILMARTEEIFKLLHANQDKRAILKSFTVWIIRETEAITHLVREKLLTIRKSKYLRAGGYFGYLIAGRVRNCEAALSAFSGSLLDTIGVSTAVEGILRIEHLLHLDNKYNPLSENSIFKLKISSESVQRTINAIPYDHWSREHKLIPEDKLLDGQHVDYLSSISERESNTTIEPSEPITFEQGHEFNERRGRMLLETTRIPPMLAIPRECEISSIIAFTLNSKYYSAALSTLLLKNHVTPKARRPRIKCSSSIPSLPKNNVESWQRVSNMKYELEHITYEENVNGLYICCKVMCAAAFNSLRQALGEDKYYVPSLFRCYSWDRAGGKSDSRFFKTADGRYILKEVSKFEQCTLCEAMPEYLEYINSAIINERPTLLAVPLGAYSINYKRHSSQIQKIDLIVTQNIFYNRNASKIYDLKGSSRGRRVQPNNEYGQVLMDENYIEFLGEAPPTFIHRHDREFIRAATWNDTHFLSSLNVMDYSLAVGISRDKKLMTVSILDYMRTFTWDKRLENWVKESSTLLNSKRAEPTIVSPDQYGLRFRRAVYDYFRAVPDEYSNLPGDDTPEPDRPGES